MNFCTNNIDERLCCDYYKDFSVQEFRRELFNSLDRDRFRDWDQWFCFGCAPNQPNMTTYTKTGDAGVTVHGEISLCEEFAKKLYLNDKGVNGTSDLDYPPTGYDKYGMYYNVGWFVELEADGSDLKFAKEDKWEPVYPGYTWLNADEFFQEDQFKPPMFRGDDDQNFDVVIIRDADREQWMEDTGKECFYDKFNLGGATGNLVIGAFALVVSSLSLI